jgi:hypothetical protein
MQYQTGSIAVTAGSRTVVGAGTKWLTDSTPIVAGDEFVVLGSVLFYQVASVQSDTQLTLVDPFAGVNTTGASYYIVRDFTSLGIPVLQRGDVDVPNVIGRMSRKINQLLTANGGGIAIPVTVNQGGTGAQTLTDNGLLFGSGAGAIRAKASLAVGSLLVGAGPSALPSELTIGANNKVLVSNGMTPVWATHDAVNTGYDDSVTQMGPSTVQWAIESLFVMLAGGVSFDFSNPFNFTDGLWAGVI